MRVRIMISDGRFKINGRRLKSLIGKVLAGESAGSKILNIVYCTDKLIGDLNDRFLNKRGTTDVLAFGLEDTENIEFLGEVYVNLQQARRQAYQNDLNYGEEVGRLTVHGILHLLGYGDGNKESRRKMWFRQEGYLQKWKK